MVTMLLAPDATVLLVALGIVAALLAYALPAGGAWILTHNGHDPRIAVYEAEYFIALSPCAGLICMETPFLSFFTGRGRTRIVAAIKIIGAARTNSHSKAWNATPRTAVSGSL